MGSKRDVYQRADQWTLKAKAAGYPARSVYKLAEIDQRFALTRGARLVLDLGASPGSWSAWLLRRLASRGKVIAVDLNPLDATVAGGNLMFIQGDMTAEAVQGQLAAFAPFDLVLSDAAPLTSGNHSVDTSRSCELFCAALGCAQRLLKAGGRFCAKVFQGGGERQLLDDVKAMFAEARVVKPKACRPSSREIYLVGLGYEGNLGGDNV